MCCVSAAVGADILAVPALARLGKCIVEVDGDRPIEGRCHAYRLSGGKLPLLSPSRYLLIALHPSPERDGSADAVAARVRIYGTFATYPLGTVVRQGECRVGTDGPVCRPGVC